MLVPQEKKRQAVGHNKSLTGGDEPFPANLRQIFGLQPVENPVRPRLSADQRQVNTLPGPQTQAERFKPFLFFREPLAICDRQLTHSEPFAVSGDTPDVPPADTVPEGVGRRTQTQIRNAMPVFAVMAGDVELGRLEYKYLGIVDVFCLKKADMTTAFAMENCEKLLQNATCEFVQKYIIK